MTAVGRLLPAADMPKQEVGYWAMVLFCFTEASLFAYLLSSYFFLGVSNPSWPPAGIDKPSLGKPLTMTILLVSSSVVLIVAERARNRGNKRAYLIGTALTILLGLGFLSVQVTEYAEKIPIVPPHASAYASMFFLITGFHGSHVAFGLAMLAWTWIADARGRLSPSRPLAVKNTALYWHFVDAVWLVILTSLYLSPRWY